MPETPDNKTMEALKLLREIKSVTFATVNNGEPAVRTIDVMLIDERGLYFVTARGKSFHKQLLDTGKTAISGMGKDYVAVRLIGDIKIMQDGGMLDRIFNANPMMNDLYPGDKRYILDVFHLYRGRGEIFDLSTIHPKRERFAFGGAEVNPPGYSINSDCTECGVCLDKCPTNAISEGTPYIIDGRICLECGHCAEVCPADAIEESRGL